MIAGAEIAQDSLAVRQRVEDLAAVILEPAGIADGDVIEEIGKVAERLGPSPYASLPVESGVRMFIL